MMIRQLTIGAAHTINLGNYSSMRIEASITIDLPEGDDFELAKERAQTELRSLLEETLDRQKRDRGELI